MDIFNVMYITNRNLLSYKHTYDILVNDILWYPGINVLNVFPN